MLVLSRRTKESIVIGNGITITVVSLQGNKVKLGIDAPQEVPVHRQEVADAIKMDRRLRTASVEEAAMNSRQVLVVSNDPRTRSDLRAMLLDEGDEVDVDIAKTSACALERADEKEYDVAIIDESLEKARGQELFERMQNSQTGLRGILCSEHPTIDTVEAAIDSGMLHVVQKPIRRTEILQLVEI